MNVMSPVSALVPQADHADRERSENAARRPVLILVSRLPFPLDDGWKTRTYHVIHEIAAEEKLALATLDPIAAMAAYDKAQLDALLREVNTGDAALQTMLAELAAKNGIIEADSVNFPEYDESTANDVEMITCPHCGKAFPK